MKKDKYRLSSMNIKPNLQTPSRIFSDPLEIALSKGELFELGRTIKNRREARTKK